MEKSTLFIRPLLIRPQGPAQTGREVSTCSRWFLRAGYRLATGSRSSHNGPEGPSTYNKRRSTDHLNPSPSSYSITPFSDHCVVNLFAGNGGHGCVSFVREKYVPEGPPNGGDGGTGGSVYIQAVRGETSLHKLARKRELRAGRGRNGRGRNQGGERGEDILFTVPVGTIVREVWRHDPVEQERASIKSRNTRSGALPSDHYENTQTSNLVRYPGSMRESDFSFGESLASMKIPKHAVSAMQLPAPIFLDLDKPMERPVLLAAGATGGLGNPHFVTKDFLRPKFATKGDEGLRLILSFELKMLADVGLVGLPNAGKSTLLRSLSNSRTRVGSWEFTTLQPNIGTVVLDDHRGRPVIQSYEKSGELRSSFTIADIPGLIEGAHLNKGLGLGFLRHVERASVLAFVIDLSAGNAVTALKALWTEVGEYETLRSKETNTETEQRMSQPVVQLEARKDLPLLTTCPISAKPWFVVATKADVPDTQENFASLKTYIDLLRNNQIDHPSGRPNAWRKGVVVIPVSAINAEGVDKIPRTVVDLL